MDRIRVHGDNNIIVNGNNNQISIDSSSSSQTPKQQIEIKYLKLYRQNYPSLDYSVFFIFFMIFAGFGMTHIMITFPIFIILGYVTWSYLPKLLPLYVDLYTDKLVIGNKTIMFDDIDDSKAYDGKFKYIIDDKDYEIMFYQNSYASFVDRTYKAYKNSLI